jgi:hypothetical protein
VLFPFVSFNKKKTHAYPMACAVTMDPIALAPLMSPLITAGFAMTLFSKSIGPPAAIAFLFWYVATYLGFFFEDSVASRTDFIAWPIGFYGLGMAMAAVLSQMGTYPRLFDYFDMLRTTRDASSRIFDNRRTVWEGLVLVLSIFAIYFGALFVNGNLSDGCLLVPENVAIAVGWTMIAFGIVGIIAIILVTIFDTAPCDPCHMSAATIERRRMWKYVITCLLLIGGHIILNDFLAASEVVGIWYGLIGLIPVVVIWVTLYWWIICVSFYTDLEADYAIKLSGLGEQRSSLMDLSALDGFRIPERVVPFVVTGGIYNVISVLIVWLVVIFVDSDVALLWSFVAAAIFTAIAIVIVIVLANTTTLYYSGVIMASGCRVEPMCPIIRQEPMCPIIRPELVSPVFIRPEPMCPIRQEPVCPIVRQEPVCPVIRQEPVCPVRPTNSAYRSDNFYRV